MEGTDRRTLPARDYWDPDVHERERRAVFGREWLALAAADQLRAPGDVVAVTVAGWPLVLAVDGDGEVRGFHNLCRHRAGPLVDDGAQTCPGGFVCRYHGWSYGLDGGLRRARDFGCDPDPATHGLVPIRVARWRAFVFGCLDDAAPPLDDALGGFADEVADLPMEELSFSRELRHVVEANWKAYADNYLEGYHVPLVHPGLNREIDASRYEVEVGDRWCRHSAPARTGAVNTGRWVWRFPNTCLTVYPDAMNLERYWPIGPTRTQVTYTFFFRDPAASAENESAMRVATEILGEDRRICEAVQRNLEAGVYETGPLSPRHEEAVGAFQRWVRESGGP